MPVLCMVVSPVLRALPFERHPRFYLKDSLTPAHLCSTVTSSRPILPTF